jgi:predicted nucleic-acid-binding Zn-ribbon protein
MNKNKKILPIKRFFEKELKCYTCGFSEKKQKQFRFIEIRRQELIKHTTGIIQGEVECITDGTNLVFKVCPKCGSLSIAE